MRGAMGVRGRTTAFWRTGALLVLVGPLASALSAQRGRLSETRTPAELPDAPGASREASFQLSPSAQQASAPQAAASVAGTVLDTDGAAVKGAFIVLEDIRTNDKHAAQSGEDGTFVFAGVAATTYKVSVSAPGFAPYVNGSVVAHPGETLQLPQIALEIAPVSISVDAVFSPYEMAEDEIRVEEKQRVLLIVPNFYVTYNWRAAPMSSGQKYRLAIRNNIDPFAFVGAGFSAAVEQASNSFPGYGQGAAGFARRFGAAYGDEFIGTFLGGAVIPSLLHQDPRYFYKGTGTIKARTLYAISTVFICKGDNGKWQPNYSNVIGTLASAGISNAYYPSTDQKGGGVVVTNALIGLGAGAFNGLMQEFVLRKIMFHSAPPPQSAPVSTPAKQP